MQRVRKQLLSWFPVVMLYSGLIMVFYETVVEKLDRPYLLALLGAMMGLGEIVRAIAAVLEAPRTTGPPEPPRRQKSGRRTT